MYLSLLLQATEPLYYPWGQDQPTRDESGKVEGRKRAVARDNLELNPKVSGAHMLKNVLVEHRYIESYLIFFGLIISCLPLLSPIHSLLGWRSRWVGKGVAEHL